MAVLLTMISSLTVWQISNSSHTVVSMAERAICNVQDNAQQITPSCCEPLAKCHKLWFVALYHELCSLFHNVLPSQMDGRFCLEVLGSLCVENHLHDCHIFCFSVYALQNTLQAENTISKWNPHAHLGVIFCPSPFHAMNVYLVLNPTTGLVSPQYHVSCDDFFETVQTPDTSIEPTWRVLASFENPLGENQEEPFMVAPHLLHPWTPLLSLMHKTPHLCNRIPSLKLYLSIIKYLFH